MKNQFKNLRLTFILILIGIHVNNYAQVEVNSSSYLEINSGAYLKASHDMEINSGGSVKIRGYVTVSGTLSNEAGTGGLLIKSDATGTGSLINQTTDVPGSVKRYIPQYSGDAGWHNLASCVETQAIRPEFVNNGTPNAANDLFKYDEVTGYWINTKDGSGNWNDNFEDNFVVGRGYTIAYNENITKTFIGDLNAANYTLNQSSTPAITYTPGKGEGWNLVGNPYPSAIDWDECSKTNINAALYAYDGDLGQYRSWNGTTGNLTGGIIPIGNAFFIKAASDASLTIPNSARLHTSTNFYKNSNNVKDLLILKVEGNGFLDETYILFNNIATSGFDTQYDAYKMFGIEEAPQLFTRTGDTKFSINVLPYTSDEIIIPLDLKVSVNTNYKISVIENTFWETVSIYLKDLLTGETYNLRTYNEVVFEHSPANAAERFLLLINGATSIDEPENISENIAVFSFDNKIFIQSDNSEKLNVSVFNMLGQHISSFSGMIDQNNSIEMTLNEKTGFYIVRVKSNKGIITKKVFIN